MQFFFYTTMIDTAFYRAMLRVCRSVYMSVRLSVRPSVCASVTLRYRDHIGRNTSQIISRPTSLRYLLILTPTSAIWSNENTPKSRVEQGWGSWEQKPAISLKRCKIRPRLLWRTNRKARSRPWNYLRSIPTYVIRPWPWPKRTLAEKIVLRSPLEKFEWR